MIVGTVRNSVNMAMLDLKWQQKKQDINTNQKQQKEMTPEERQLIRFQEQIEQMNENRKPAAIDAKLESGAKLTPEEIEYLRKHNPQALKEYEQLQAERKKYARKLRKCKSKEEVEQLKLSKMGEYLSQVKKISTNPNIPKSAKIALLKKILKQVSGIQSEHQEFTETAEYAMLPENEEERKEQERDTVHNTVRETDSSQSVTEYPEEATVNESDNGNASASTADNAVIETATPNDPASTATATDVISEIKSAVEGLDSDSLSTANIDIKI